MADPKYVIPTLTPEEIQTLQVDAALRIIAQNGTLLVQINQEISQAIVAKCKADSHLQQLKNDKTTVVELNRSLKVMVENG